MINKEHILTNVLELVVGRIIGLWDMKKNKELKKI
jgi:hypothetical protein